MTALASTCIGTVYGVLLNDRATLARLAPELKEPPYKAPPRAPVLYIKPRNTHARDGAAVPVPFDPGVVRVEASIGLVIGRTAWRTPVAEALSHVAGYVIASDLTLPHDNYFRPAIRQRCCDQFCPMSQPMEPAPGFVVDDAALEVCVRNRLGTITLTYRRRFSTLVRSAAVLLADVTEFMTLSPGDILLLGSGDLSPEARIGDSVTISVPGLGQLQHTLAAEAEAPT